MPLAGKSEGDPLDVPATTGEPAALLRVNDLRVHFPVRRGLLGRGGGPVRAVDGVSFALPRGETLGLVGESGCGKTTAGRAILRLIPATSGHVEFDGADVFALGARALRAQRRHMQIVFQDPYGSLNPRMTVEDIVGEPLLVHRLASRRKRREEVAAALERVGIAAAGMSRYPHEFSGGQRQRISIARAMILRPRFVVCDECVSALDVSVQSQILNLLADLQAELGVAYLFIAHNLAVVRQISRRIAVMYLGRIVEIGGAEELFDRPAHPYTRLLLSSIPRIETVEQETRRPLRVLGEAPSPLHAPAGCAFHPRCPLADDRCRRESPALEPKNGLAPDHRVACHYPDPKLTWPLQELR